MQYVNVYEPISNVTSDVQRTHIVYSGGHYYNHQIYTADSWSSSLTAQTLFTINPPSTQTIMDRNVKIRCYFEVTVDADLKLTLDDSLRQFPINSLIDNLIIQINGTTLSENVADKIHALMTYGNNMQTRNDSCSISLAQPDQFQEYADYATLGTARNVCAAYGENSAEPSRGSCTTIVLDPVTPLRKFRVVLTEPIITSPFESPFCKDKEEGFVNINQMNFTFRWVQNVSRILSHSILGNPINVVSVTMYSPPQLLVLYVTPAMGQVLPSVQTLFYHKTLDYIKVQPTILPGASALYISDSIKMSQILESLLFFVRRNRSLMNHTTSDSFCRIDNVNILYNNQSSLLSTATSDQLYEITKRNGSNLSYAAFNKFRGGVMKINFGKDIALIEGEAPGMQGQYTIQLQIQYTNTSNTTLVTPEAFLCLNMVGMVQIMENACVISLGNLNKEIVTEVQSSGGQISHADYMNLQGGSFLSGLKNFFNKVSKFISPVAHALSNVPMLAPYAGPIATVADAVKTATGGKLKGKGLSGGGLSGGSRRMSRR